MKTKILALVLGALLTIPCVLRAEEVEIQLMDGNSIDVSDIPQGTYLLSVTCKGRPYSTIFIKQ